MKLSFKIQIVIAALIVIASLFIGQSIGEPLLFNVGWMLAGILFIINPVAPKSTSWPKKQSDQYMRMFGALLIVVGWFSKNI